ncbi:hypothetical protein L204_104637 [Cryptococcus depauperatus]
MVMPVSLLDQTHKHHTQSSAAHCTATCRSKDMSTSFLHTSYVPSGHRFASYGQNLDCESSRRPRYSPIQSNTKSQIDPSHATSGTSCLGFSSMSAARQLLPSTPSPPPPYHSSFLHHTSPRFESNSKLMKRQTSPFLSSSCAGARGRISGEFSTNSMPVGTSSGVEVEEFRDVEMESILQLGSRNFNNHSRRRLEVLKNQIERQVRAETCQRIKQLTNDLLSAQKKIRVLEQEKREMEDELREAVERVSAEYQQSVRLAEKVPPSGLRPLSLLSKGRSTLAHDSDSPKVRYRSISILPDASERQSRLKTLPYHSSPIPSLEPPTSPTCPDSEFSSDSSLSTPMPSPTHQPHCPQTYRLSQTFTALSSQSINAHAYERMEFSTDSTFSPTITESIFDNGSNETLRVKPRGRPKTLFSWPRPAENGVNQPSTKEGFSPIMNTYNKLVGRHELANRELMQLQQAQLSPDMVEGTSNASGLESARGLFKRLYNGSPRARKRSSRNMDLAGIGDQPSLLFGYKIIQRRNGHQTCPSPPNSANKVLSASSCPSSPRQLPSNVSHDQAVANCLQNLQLQSQHLAYNPNNSYHMTAILGTIAKCSGWATVIGFAGLTLGGWISKR